MVGKISSKAFLFSVFMTAGPAAAQVVEIESRYVLADSSVEWLSAAIIPTRFDPVFGENSERPFFPALGTLIDSRGQLFVGTSVSMSAICNVPSGCPTTNSVLTFSHAVTAQFLGDPTITFSGTTFTATNYPPPEVPFALTYRGVVEAGGGIWSITAPRSEPLRVTHTVSGPTPLVGDRFVIDGEVSLFQRYTPFSSGRYIQDGVVLAAGAGATTNLAAAAGATGYVRILRTSSGGTSQGNLSLRNAEYELYGYGAGVAIREGRLFTFSPDSTGADGLNGFVGMPLLQTPAGASTYYVVKQIGRYVPGAKAAWSAIFGAPPGQSTNLPGTGDFFGGLGSNTRGFVHGVFGGSVSTLGNCIDLGDCNRQASPPPVPPRMAGGAAATAPRAADELMRESIVAEGSTVTATLQQIEVPEDMMATVALPRFDDHFVAAIGGLISGVRLVGPDAATTNAVIIVGDSEIGSRWSFASGAFSFIEHLGAPVEAFVILNLAAELLPTDRATFALDFASGGSILLQTVSVSAVPEVSSLVLFAAGMLLVTAGFRLRVKNPS